MWWVLFIVWLFCVLLVWAFIAGASIVSGSFYEEDEE